MAYSSLPGNQEPYFPQKNLKEGDILELAWIDISECIGHLQWDPQAALIVYNIMEQDIRQQLVNAAAKMQFSCLRHPE